MLALAEHVGLKHANLTGKYYFWLVQYAYFIYKPMKEQHKHIKSYSFTFKFIDFQSVPQRFVACAPILAACR